MPVTGVDCSRHAHVFFLVEHNCTTDVVIIVDSAGDIGEARWHVVKQFVIDVILGLNTKATGTRIGVVVFSTQVNVVFGIGEYDNPGNMSRAVWDAPYMAGATNTADGIEAMHEMFSDTERPDIQQIAILLAASASNVDNARTLLEATSAKDDDIYMVVLGKTSLLSTVVTNFATFFLHHSFLAYQGRVG